MQPKPRKGNRCCRPLQPPPSLGAGGLGLVSDATGRQTAVNHGRELIHVCINLSYLTTDIAMFLHVASDNENCR